MDFAPAPATVADLRALLAGIRAALNTHKPNARNAAGFRARVQDILSSTLTAPGAG